MSRLLDYIVTVGRARLSAEAQADTLAVAVRNFLKGKRGQEFNQLRSALDAYDRDFRNRPVFDAPPEEVADRWQ